MQGEYLWVLIYASAYINIIVRNYPNMRLYNVSIVWLYANGFFQTCLTVLAVQAGRKIHNIMNAEGNNFHVQNLGHRITVYLDNFMNLNLYRQIRQDFYCVLAEPV